MYCDILTNFTPLELIAKFLLFRFSITTRNRASVSSDEAFTFVVHSNLYYNFLKSVAQSV